MTKDKFLEEAEKILRRKDSMQFKQPVEAEDEALEALYQLHLQCKHLEGVREVKEEINREIIFLQQGGVRHLDMIGGLKRAIEFLNKLNNPGKEL